MDLNHYSDQSSTSMTTPETTPDTNETTDTADTTTSTTTTTPLPKLLCRFYMQNSCIFGDKCTNSHNIEDKKYMPECEHYKKGQCRFGQDCIYLHTKKPRFCASNSKSTETSWSKKNRNNNNNNNNKSSFPAKEPYYKILKPVLSAASTPVVPESRSDQDPIVKICVTCGEYLVSPFQCELCHQKTL